VTDPVEPESDRPERSTPTVMEQMGGIAGIVASSLPLAVFIVVNIIT
jgi:hypothetical protein